MCRERPRRKLNGGMSSVRAVTEGRGGKSMLNTNVGLPAVWLWVSCQQWRRRMIRTQGTLQYLPLLEPLSNLEQS